MLCHYPRIKNPEFQGSWAVHFNCMPSVWTSIHILRSQPAKPNTVSRELTQCRNIHAEHIPCKEPKKDGYGSHSEGAFKNESGPNLCQLCWTLIRREHLPVIFTSPHLTSNTSFDCHVQTINFHDCDEEWHTEIEMCGRELIVT